MGSVGAWSVRGVTFTGAAVALFVACSGTSTGGAGSCTNDYSGKWALSGACITTSCTFTQTGCALDMACQDGTHGTGSVTGTQGSVSGVLADGTNGSCSLAFSGKSVSLSCTKATSTQPCNGTGACQSGACGAPIPDASDGTSGGTSGTSGGTSGTSGGTSGTVSDGGSSGTSGTSGTGSDGGTCTTNYSGSWTQTGTCQEPTCTVAQAGCSVTVSCVNGTTLAGKISGNGVALSGSSQGTALSCTATFTSATSYSLNCGICTAVGTKK